MTTIYDSQIKAAAEEYLPGTDWRLLKAQLRAESALNPNAKSHVGAQGIAQFMPDTWEQIRQEMHMPEQASAYDPDYAIPAAAYYMAKLNKKWSAPRPDADRYCLALASYNAGFGNLIKAQKHAGNPNEYHAIITALPHITGEHARETTTYVQRIFRYFCEYLIDGNL